MSFECLNVKIGVGSDCAEFIEALEKSLPLVIPIRHRKIPGDEAEQQFSVLFDRAGERQPGVYKGDLLTAASGSTEAVIDSLESQIRLTIAELSGDYVFLHAGAVSRNGRAIIIPGKSFTGKTTLVMELIKNGFEYLSDEYALLDRDGLAHAFPKRLSVRGIIDDYRQVEIGAEEFGAAFCLAPVPVNCVLIVEYDKKTKKPVIKRVGAGEGMMAALANSISVRRNPQFVLETLGAVAQRALILKAVRGEAAEFVELFDEFWEGYEARSESADALENFEKPLRAAAKDASKDKSLRAR